MPIMPSSRHSHSTSYRHMPYNRATRGAIRSKHPTSNQVVIGTACVYRWNQHETKVFCPYCHDIHVHPGTIISHYFNNTLYDAPCLSSDAAINQNGSTETDSNGQKAEVESENGCENSDSEQNSDEDDDDYEKETDGEKSESEGEREEADGDGKGAAVIRMDGHSSYRYRLNFPEYWERSSDSQLGPYYFSPRWKQVAERRNYEKVEFTDHDQSTLELRSFTTWEATLLKNTPKGSVKITEWELTAQGKTMGMLLRDKGVEPVVTESGWAHNWSFYPRQCQVIQRSIYTGQVLERCKRTGFTLPSDYRDMGVPGRYYASFAEMQLMEWYLQKHVIGSTEGIHSFAGLEGIQPPEPPCVVILVSRLYEDICVRYSRHLNSKYHVQFDLRY